MTRSAPEKACAERGFRVLDFFCGIGGCAAALEAIAADAPGGPRPTVAAALDVNRLALGVYGHNFPHPAIACTLDSLPAARLRRWQADLWWLSPPCQPFTVRGQRRDVDDPRARPLLALIARLVEVRPRYLAVENVPGFCGSRAHALLRETLERAGYGMVVERILCPSELGIPNRRRRYYLVAAADRLAAVEMPPPRTAPLGAYLDSEETPGLGVDQDLLRRYRGALDIVDAGDPEAMTACFTSAYGRSVVRSGSYLATDSGVRRFSPREILRLLGFGPSFELPPELGLRNAWRLVGNSLSVVAVRAMLATIPELV